jgi:glycine cleavage system H protein
VVGITDFAQAQLSDLTYAELPERGAKLEARDEAAVLESVKAAADVYSPVSGTVIDINEQLVDNPDLVNNDPYGEGWIFKLDVSNEAELDELMDAEQYEESLPEDDV